MEGNSPFTTSKMPFLSTVKNETFLMLLLWLIHQISCSCNEYSGNFAASCPIHTPVWRSPSTERGGAVDLAGFFANGKSWICRLFALIRGNIDESLLTFKSCSFISYNSINCFSINYAFYTNKFNCWELQSCNFLHTIVFPYTINNYCY